MVIGVGGGDGVLTAREDMHSTSDPSASVCGIDGNVCSARIDTQDTSSRVEVVITRFIVGLHTLIYLHVF